MPTTKETQNRSKIAASTMQIPIKVDSVGNQSSLPKPTAKTVTHNDKTYYVHHIHDNYGASKDGSIINLETKETDIGTLHKFGRYYFQAAKKFKPGEKRYYQKRKFFYNYRFVYEAISQQSLSSDDIIRHIDGNILNNSFDNLKLGKRSEFSDKETEWNRKQFTCPNCQNQMRNGSKSKHLKSCIPKTMDALDECDSDNLTEDEKQLIDIQYNAMMKKIKNGDFPYRTHLQKHFPEVEFW